MLSIPILFAIGAAVDYGRRNSVKVQLDAALDGAILAVMAQKTNTISSANILSMESQFRAEAAKLAGVTITSFTPSLPVNGASSLSLSASYTASVRTSLSAMMKVPDLSMGSTSSSTRNLFQYINFYLLLDNSPSMGWWRRIRRDQHAARDGRMRFRVPRAHLRQ